VQQNVDFPLIAIDEDGRVYFLADQSDFAGIEEMFVHGEISLVMSLTGQKYVYEHYDDRQILSITLEKSEPGDPAALINAVWNRFDQVCRSKPRHRNALRAARKIDPEVVERIRAASNHELGQVFLVSCILELD
jgi:hypothetical protein